MASNEPENMRPPHTRDLAGLRVGRLTVSHIHGIARDGHLTWLCRCECGKEKAVSSNSITREIPVQSCGCLNKDRAQVKRRLGGPWNDGKSYVIASGEHCYKTRHGWARAAIKHYGNRCERCGSRKREDGRRRRFYGRRKDQLKPNLIKECVETERLAIASLKTPAHSFPVKIEGAPQLFFAPRRPL